MKVEIHDYNIGTQSGDALVLVYGDTTNFDDIIFDGTVNFEFKVDKYQTGDGYITPIENWMDIEITDVEYFDNENRRIKPKYDIQEAIEYNLIELIKDKDND
jgi:hypothetical protein